MQKLAEICVRRPVFATVIVLALVVTGLFSYLKLGVDRFPDVDFPWVTITTVLPGAAPEEVETEVTDKIEEAVNTIAGIDELYSTSSENVSVVQIGFVLEKNGDVAAQEVRDKVSAILADLPRDAEPPIVQRIDADAEPVIAVALSGPASDRDISEYADKTLRRRLETVEGVGQVVIVGSRPRQINIVVDSQKLNSVGLTSADVVWALQSQNIQIPGGRVEQGLRDLTLRTYGRVSDFREFGDIPIAQRNGYAVRLRDVARVEDGVAEIESIASVNGKPAVVLLLRKQSGTNSIAVIDRIKERVEDLRPQLPAGWEMRLIRDQSDFIIAAVDAVKEHLVLGSIFASLIVWLFLSGPRGREVMLMLAATFGVFFSFFHNEKLAHYVPLPKAVFLAIGVLIAGGMMLYFFRRSRPTVIAAVAIPSSLIATFAAMAYMGFTLNVITLLALTLAVGIVIDDAVVVLENIFRHMEEHKTSPMVAAVTGTREVGLAVMATSLSLIAVFLPVAFMGGIVGRFMYSFGVTMAFAIAVSLLVSFTLTPMMASRWLKAEDLHSGQSSREKGFYRYVDAAYMRMLDWSMAHRWAIVVLMVAVFLSTIPLFIFVDKNFLPLDDESQFAVSVRAPEGASIDTTRRLMESITTRIQQMPEVEATVVTVGDDFQQTLNLGSVYVKLKPVGERKASQFDVMQRVRTEILPLYEKLNLRTQVAPVNAFGGGIDAEIMFWIGGPDLAQLDRYAAEIVQLVKGIEGTTDVDTNFIVGKPELAVRIDRQKAADLGVRVQDIAASLNVLVGGQKATSFYEGGEEYEVHVRAEMESRSDVAGIGQIEVPSATLGTVTLRDVVTLAEGSGPSVINRLNRRRNVLVLANMLPGYSSQAVMEQITARAKEMNLPAEYSYGFTGRSREQGKAAFNFMIAFVLSGVFMYLILAAQFESWIHPVTIMLSLPLTVPFALLSILALNQSLNIFSSLGIVVLFGIVKKNSILQVDHTNQLRERGLPRGEAIRLANRDRLRPILMTTLAFVAGMIPLVVSSGAGAGTNRAIGSVIIGGQTLVLLLTLLGTPVVYSIFDDWAKSRLSGRLRSWIGVSRPEQSGIGGPATVPE
jgi:hydrophobic/amphiphilic exporter-1 (mainly G- bacteria), HAE1 family